VAGRRLSSSRSRAGWLGGPRARIGCAVEQDSGQVAGSSSCRPSGAPGNAQVSDEQVEISLHTRAELAWATVKRDILHPLPARANAPTVRPIGSCVRRAEGGTAVWHRVQEHREPKKLCNELIMQSMLLFKLSDIRAQVPLHDRCRSSLTKKVQRQPDEIQRKR
jgi:hypothetical protein